MTNINKLKNHIRILNYHKKISVRRKLSNLNITSIKKKHIFDYFFLFIIQSIYIF
jgi:hypothetical protein